MLRTTNRYLRSARATLRKILMLTREPRVAHEAERGLERCGARTRKPGS